MKKSKIVIKYLINIYKSINNLLEKNLNKLNINNLRNLSKNNKIILTFVALFIFFISYLLLPTLYNQADISKELKKKLLNNYSLNLNFENNLKYSFFPRPNFTTTETSIIDKNNEVSKIGSIKIYVSLENLFSLKKVDVKELILENLNLNLNKNNYNFFINLLSNSYLDRNLEIKNSNVFFKNSKQEVLFINKILNMKYYYDANELKNILYANNEIFNIPYNIKFYDDKEEKKLFSILDLNFLKLKINNQYDYSGKIKNGVSNFSYNKLKSNIIYEIKKNFFEYEIFEKANEPNFYYNGKFHFKPFYSSLNGNTQDLNLSYLLGSNALLTQLLKTEIFNNKNIDFQLNIVAKNLQYNSSINNLNINSKIQEGLIDVDNTKFKWKNFAEFKLVDSLIYVKDGELLLDGKLEVNINNYNEIYKFLLTPKNFRKKINKLDFNFTYNFDQKLANFEDIKVDEIIDENLNNIFRNIVLKKDKLKNKIYFRNLLNEAIKGYFG